VPAGTYRGQSQALSSVAAWNFVLANKDMPDADAYWITRKVLDTPNPLVIAPSAGPTRASNARTNTVVAFHPGALRYYREKGIQLQS
jgi:uncharacterized protein